MAAPKDRTRMCQGLGCTARVRGTLCPDCKKAIADVLRAAELARLPPPRAPYAPRVYTILAEGDR